MRLGPLAPRPPAADDVATALAGAAATLGQRPAITVVAPDLRHEQGFLSLAGWAAKGAHLLRDELGLGPGDVLGVDAPPSWPLAAVALAAWWTGVALGPVALGRPAVVHEGRPDPGGDVWWLGDAIDGGPVGPDGPARSRGEAWTTAVIPYPDRAPTPGAAPDLAAILDTEGRVTTQRGLLTAWPGDGGVLGLRRATLAATHPLEQVMALAARPLVTGAATVVVAADADAATLERITAHEHVARWV